MQRIENQIKRLLLPGGICPGIGVAYGTAETSVRLQMGSDGDGEMLGPDTVFDLASVTKFFLAIVCLKLREMGKLNLESRIQECSAKFRSVGQLRIKELMSYNVKLSTAGRIDACKTREEALKALYGTTGEYSAVQEYSDIPPMILGELLQEITGSSFGEWIQELIIGSLELKNTGWDRDFLRGKACCSYKHEMWLIKENLIEKENPVGVVNDPKARVLSDQGRELCGHAGLFSSLGDMTVILQALLAEKILSRESLMLLAEGNGWELSGEKQSYGYLCYRKYRDERQTEVPLFLSDHGVAASGFTGCYLLLDAVNGIFAFIGGNRIHNCVSKCSSDLQPQEGYFRINGASYRDSRSYVYERDALRDVICREALDIA